jgi:hypothetical protein
MSTIKAIAHLNELTKDVPNDYYLLPDKLGTLYEDDVTRRLEAKEIATKNVNRKAFVQLFHRECDYEKNNLPVLIKAVISMM